MSTCNTVRGRPAVINHPAIDDTGPRALRAAAARIGSQNLLRAQLRHGQHTLPYALACALGATIGMRDGSVRAAPGDPTITNGERA